MSPQDRMPEFERALREASVRKVQLRLFVAGMTPRSTQAIADLKKLTADLLGPDFTVDIVDIYADPAAAAEAQVIAIPTLIREQPPPKHRLVGSLANHDKVAKSLGLEPPEAPQS